MNHLIHCTLALGLMIVQSSDFRWNCSILMIIQKDLQQLYSLITYNPTIQCHQEEDGFLSRFLVHVVSLIFFCQYNLWLALNLHLDFCKDFLFNLISCGKFQTAVFWDLSQPFAAPVPAFLEDVAGMKFLYIYKNNKVYSFWTFDILSLYCVHLDIGQKQLGNRCILFLCFTQRPNFFGIRVVKLTWNFLHSH